MKMNKYRLFQIVGIFVIIMGVALIGYGNPKLVAQINPLEAEPAKPMISVMERVPPELLNATGEVDIIIELTEPAGAKAMSQQVGVMAQLQALNAQIVGTTILTVNSIHTKIDASRLPEIAAMRDVYRIYKNERIAQIVGWDEMEIQMLEESTKSMVNIAPLHNRGLDGSGITIAIMDTGIRKDLPGLQRNGESVVVYSYSVTGEEWVMWHGSAVAGCAIETAPDADILDINVFQSDGLAFLSDIMQGFEVIGEYQRSHMDKFIISSNSWGITIDGYKSDDGHDIISRQVDELSTYMPVVVAAGNNGNQYPSGYNVCSPAISRGALAVGAVTKDGDITSFSSRGPTPDGRRKPDVSAPGANIKTLDVNGGYKYVSGTSFACPIVAGCLACIAEEYGDQYKPSQYYNAAIEAADHPGMLTYSDEYGNGIFDSEGTFRILGGMTPLSVYSDSGLIVSIIGMVMLVIPAVVRWRKPF